MRRPRGNSALNGGRGIGICLGPGRAPGGGWLIDVEGDGPEAEDSRAILFGGEIVETIGWGSSRGDHRLFTVDLDRIAAIMPRLKGLEKTGEGAGAYKTDSLPGLELRIGGYNAKGEVKQVQSVVPPTIGNDGKPRQWTAGPPSIMAAPEAFYQGMERLIPAAPDGRPVAKIAEKRKQRDRANSGGKRDAKAATSSGDDQDKVERLLAKYYQTALSQEAGQIVSTPPGGRHDALRDASMNIAGLVRAGAVSENDYRRTMARAAKDCGLPDGEAEELIDSALEKATPRDLSAAREEAEQRVLEMRRKAEGGGRPDDGISTPIDPKTLANTIRDKAAAGSFADVYEDAGIMAAAGRLKTTLPGDFAGMMARLKEDRKFSSLHFMSAAKPFIGRSEAGSEGLVRVEETYVRHDDGFYRERSGDRGKHHERLTNFTAEIVEEIISDDGAGKEILYRVRGEAGGWTFEAEIRADKFDAMEWIAPSIGCSSYIFAGRGFRDHSRAAILRFSNAAVKRTLYRFTGWTTIDGRPAFLHGGGAIGPDGNDPNVRVKLSERLANYHLPDPPEGDALCEAIRSVFRLLEFAQQERAFSYTIASALVCIPFRAALGGSLCNVWADGPTGSFKTEVMANLVLRFFGARHSHDFAPGSWTATENAIEIQAFEAKDVFFLVDDYRPPDGPSGERARYEARANRVFRSSANRQGRDRSTVDGRLQQSKYPRGMLASTGETLPTDASVIARTLILSLYPDNPDRGILGSIDPTLLRQRSREAAEGLYAAAMAGFLRWMSGRYEGVRAGLRSRVERDTDVIAAALTGQYIHRRTPEMVADLLVGFEEFATFATEVGAIDSKLARGYLDFVRKGLVSGAIQQVEHTTASDQVARFFDLLRSAISHGRAFIATAKDGSAPPGKELACGWRTDYHPGRPLWTPPHGSAEVGWLDDRFLYLDLDGAFAVAQDLGRRGDAALSFSPQTLSRRIKANGMLRASENSSNTVKRSIKGAKQRVLVLEPDQLIGEETDPGEFGRDDSGPVRGPVAF